MEPPRRFEVVNDYNAFNNHPLLHPLVNVIDMSRANPRQSVNMYFGFYVVFLKEVDCGDIRYGKKNYDYQEGTLVFIAPGQVVQVDRTGVTYQPKGQALVFHPELIHGTALGRHMKDYSYFGYQSNEALHLSDNEKKIVLDCFAHIRYELEHASDQHSNRLIASNIELLLNYCVRFYDRQFVTRNNTNKSLVEKFEALLNEYFTSDAPLTIGLPNVAYCARQLNLSANYFGDLIKKETGISAQEHLQKKIILEARERLFDRSKSVSQVAEELGFKYAQHFTRFFKQQTGQSPNAYRGSL
ncbi:MAG: AraC family transcriptional regulator [Saprospiraceae bacterium]|nr:AraC family transcriptional regulator [Saprospiraceae bacterium]